ncbi:MAG: L,D-transpeptidase [Methylobacterium sp.]|uniref:L,D-transpeptidase n=1 Tax=Methylobacterium sp. TaxID=409 RepID=UPI0025FC5DF8|nr:L,D-transpeptidase [Methylobacterium sp.]MBX9934828.1 L,D-transpeptidase [Methylobacterium sp.]
MRYALGLIAAAATFMASESLAQDGRYGGGFIEFLVAGPERPSRTGPSRSGLGAEDSTLARQSEAYGYSAAASPRMLSSGDRVPPEMLYRQQVTTRLAALPQAEPQEAVSRIERGPDPRYARQVVNFDGRQSAGTIVIDTPSKFLYLVQPGGKALRYGIGVGRPGFTWSGTKTITQKKEWPDWTPPPEMLRRRPDLPRHMAGGPGNPLGARALYLGSSLYRIHGTNEPHTIGQSVSSGCIRMMNDDVTDLYERTSVGARVEVI